MKKRKLFTAAVFLSAGLLLTGCIYKPTTKECVAGYLENIYHNVPKPLPRFLALIKMNVKNCMTNTSKKKSQHFSQC